MKRDYEGKTVWITGASSGIGRALALEAASRGAALVLSARRRALLEELAAACAPAPCAVLDFDLADKAARAAACARAPGLLGPLDLIVLNAGVSQRATFLETGPEAFAAVMALDFEAQVDLVRRCLPALLERGRGSLVAVSSIAGLAGSPLRPAYSAAKHALAGFFQALRSELHGSALRVVTVYPGYVRTAIASSALGPDGRPTGVEDPHIEGGADPSRVARRILDAALSGPVERKLAFDLKTRFGLFLSRHLPTAWASLSATHAGLGDRGYRLPGGPS
jgi:short-subunit dehydrogenase